MKKQENKKRQPLATAILSVISVILALTCLTLRLPDILSTDGNAFSLFAAGLVLPQGGRALAQKGAESAAQSIPESTTSDNKQDEKEASASSAISSAQSSKSSDEKKEESSSAASSTSTQSKPKKDEKTYGIVEMQFGASGMQYNNFSIKNATGTKLDVKEELSKKPDLTIQKNGDPQVLIVHTHTCESYMDEDLGYYYESFYPRTDDKSRNVVQVGNAIAEKLKAAGIGVVHDTTIHDSTYNGSYGRSRETIQKNLDKYPSIEVVLDIHRDGLQQEDKSKIKPTCVINGEKTAQIMIISGCDVDGSLGFPDWEYNLRLALRLQQTAENMYPGFTRPLYFSQTKYNMDMTHSSLLIEVGSDSNTLQEAVRAGGYLGDVLVDVLNGLTE